MSSRGESPEIQVTEPPLEPRSSHPHHPSHNPSSHPSMEGLSSPPFKRPSHDVTMYDSADEDMEDIRGGGKDDSNNSKDDSDDEERRKQLVNMIILKMLEMFCETKYQDHTTLNAEITPDNHKWAHH